MPQSYTTEFPKKIVAFAEKKTALTKVSLLSSSYPKPSISNVVSFP